MPCKRAGCLFGDSGGDFAADAGVDQRLSRSQDRMLDRGQHGVEHHNPGHDPGAQDQLMQGSSNITRRYHETGVMAKMAMSPTHTEGISDTKEVSRKLASG